MRPHIECESGLRVELEKIARIKTRQIRQDIPDLPFGFGLVALFSPEALRYGMTEFIREPHDDRRLIHHFISDLFGRFVEVGKRRFDQRWVVQITKHKFEIYLPVPILGRDLGKSLKRDPVAQH